jgi:hypothetical protein
MATPEQLGLKKAAYSVNEALSICSIGRTSFYEAVKNGEIRPAKLGKKTLVLADNIAEYLTKLREPHSLATAISQAEA